MSIVNYGFSKQYAGSMVSDRCPLGYLLILSKPPAKVINRVDASRHIVIIITLKSVCFRFCSPKSTFLIAKIHIVAIINFLQISSFDFVGPKLFIDINQ